MTFEQLALRHEISMSKDMEKYCHQIQSVTMGNPSLASFSASLFFERVVFFSADCCRQEFFHVIALLRGIYMPLQKEYFTKSANGKFFPHLLKKTFLNPEIAKNISVS